MIVKAGVRLPKYLRLALGDEVMVRLWNQGTENRAAARGKEEENTRLLSFQTHSKVRTFSAAEAAVYSSGE